MMRTGPGGAVAGISARRSRGAGGAVAGVGLLLAGVLWPEAADAQCAMCRRALESPDAQALAAAFRSGVLLLLAAPFGVFGVVATMAVRAHRRRESGSPEGGSEASPLLR